MKYLLCLLLLAPRVLIAQGDVIRFEVTTAVLDDSLAGALPTRVTMVPAALPPPAIPTFPCIDLSGLGLKRVPADSVRIRLSKLDFSGNNMRRFRWPGEVINVDTLDLSGNRMRRYGSHYAFLSTKSYHSNVKVLNLSNNELEAGKISQVGRVKELDLSNNLFTHYNLAQHGAVLRSIDLSGNLLSQAPAGFREVWNLEYLMLADNSITSIPSSIARASSLRILDLRGNYLDALPRQLRKLKKLELLDVRDNPLDQKELDKLRDRLPEGCVFLHD